MGGLFLRPLVALSLLFPQLLLAERVEQTVMPQCRVDNSLVGVDQLMTSLMDDDFFKREAAEEALTNCCIGFDRDAAISITGFFSLWLGKLDAEGRDRLGRILAKCRQRIATDVDTCAADEDRVDVEISCGIQRSNGTLIRIESHVCELRDVGASSDRYQWEANALPVCRPGKMEVSFFTRVGSDVRYDPVAARRHCEEWVWKDETEYSPAGSLLDQVVISDVYQNPTTDASIAAAIQAGNTALGDALLAAQTRWRDMVKKRDKDVVCDNRLPKLEAMLAGYGREKCAELYLDYKMKLTVPGCKKRPLPIAPAPVPVKAGAE